MPTHEPSFISLGKPPRFLSQDEVAAFFAVIASARDRALFGLIYHYGLRVSEATRLRVKDVDLASGRILIRRAKHGIWGIRPLLASTRALLSAYLPELQQRDPEAALFPGRTGPLQKRRIQQLFNRYAHTAGLPSKASCHSLRHAIATPLLDAGESLEFVKEHLGHQKIENTAIYARVSNPARDRAFARLEKSAAIVHPTVKRRLPSPAASLERRGGATE